MSNSYNKDFDKFIGQRLRFRGTYDGYVQINKGTYRVCFVDVCEVSSNEPFRQHVNILCTTGEYNHHFSNSLGDVFEFTAELYRYTKNPHGRTHYRTWGVGLKDMRKTEVIE